MRVILVMTKLQNLILVLADHPLLENSFKPLVYIKILRVLRFPTVGVSWICTRDIVDMASRYPGRGFYEYHKKISADAAAHLRYNNTKVDWSIRNNTLFCNIFANTRPNACNVCGTTFHGTGFCGQSVYAQTKNQINQKQTDPDTYGRERIYYLGREICNNFNGA